MNPSALILAAVLLSGCAASQAAQQAATDTYCLSARKIIWSIEDSPETIQRAEIHNKTIDKRCGVPTKPAS
jgi:outer membrane murein-binding lipoprotein Lpp